MSFADWITGLPQTQIAPKGLQSVQETQELRRIRDAAWRPWDRAEDLEAGRAALTQWLRVPGGTRELKHVQAAVLRALVDHLGCFAPVRTGGGKTDISLLAATCLQARGGAKQPLLLVPAALREKTKRNAAALAKHYRIAPLRILSWESLSLAKHAEILLSWQPDLLILDEAHMCKDSGGARWKRIKRYDAWRMKQGFAPAPMLAMSGSFTSRSIREYWHILRRCMGDAAPVPRDPIEMSAWALALDEKVPEAARIGPGALLGLAQALAEDHGLEPLQVARQRYGRRLCATAGVVASGGDMPECGLEITVEELEPTPEIKAAVNHLRTTWETPCGLPFETAMELWRHEREVSCGLYYRWKHQPPPEWMQARREWSVFIRETLSRSKRWDTPMQVAIAIHEGNCSDGVDVLTAWRDQEPRFKPQIEPVWICDSTLRYAAEWLEKHRGICWVHHKAFGFALEALSGIPYFHERGTNSAGIPIDQHPGPAIASIRSCSMGFDLQGTPTTKAAHHRNVVITSPTKNGPWEQLLSRTHRDMQREDTVYCTILQRLEGDIQALAQSRADAKMVEGTKRQPQRLTVATWPND